ncbi:acyl-CoA dehydrogenase [Aeropyrum camini SY1 = JCM 12091]|uniref:Acyl-CoA dehydrogenase n=1 Tax=Aeropyrum camini SY1 = JCM 12091 TaxID=1198449 RepID=U3TCS1_9CREN|nr:acyl-CoA dehydrogenase [Aeropyrum camini SY1 = JCM 12091]
MSRHRLYIPADPTLDNGMHRRNRVYTAPSNPHNPYATHTGHPGGFRAAGEMQSQPPYYTRRSPHSISLLLLQRGFPYWLQPRRAQKLKLNSHIG